MTTGVTASVLTDDLLARCLERAPGYDKENKFFQEDFDELKAAGYLNIAVPKELGGGGMTLAEVCREWKLAKTTEPYKPLPKGEPYVVHQVWAFQVA